MQIPKRQPFLALVLLLLGCDVDAFNASCRSVAGDYCLKRWEDFKTFYLDDREQENDYGGGAIGGVVEQIGWSDNYIIAKRRANFAGDPNGWMVIEVGSKIIRGPYDDLELAGLREAQGIIPVDPDKAWQMLR